MVQRRRYLGRRKPHELRNAILAALGILTATFFAVYGYILLSSWLIPQLP